MADDPDVTIWSTAISTSSVTGRKVIFRFADLLNPAFDRKSQPDRIIIVWTYQSETGQPLSEEHRQMNIMEDALETVLYQDRFATLALVSTGEGLREWTYYAKSEDEFMDRLNVALAGMPTFPIDVHTAHDPNGNMYEEFKARVKETVTSRASIKPSPPLAFPTSATGSAAAQQRRERSREHSRSLPQW